MGPTPASSLQALREVRLRSRLSGVNWTPRAGSESHHMEPPRKTGPQDPTQFPQAQEVDRVSVPSTWDGPTQQAYQTAGGGLRPPNCT